MNIDDLQQEIIEEFSMFNDWTDRYNYIIELGKSLPIISQELKNEKNLIKGCQSRVWLNAELKNNKLIFTADSDAIITKGIIAILIRVFSNQPLRDIINAKSTFIDTIGLREHLSPTRANGLLSMIKQIKLYAVVFMKQKEREKNA